MMGLPKPFVPEEVDLRSYVYMPLEVGRLRDSDTAASVSGEAFRAAVLLWCAAWHQLPAASLPDNDMALARLAGFGRHMDDWLEVKDEALRGFTLCSDGRLYHSTLAEIALSAWNDKKRKHARTAAATAARQANRGASKSEANERDEDRHDQRNVERHDDVSSTKEKKEKKERTNNAREMRDAFDRDFWSKYPHKVGKAMALKAWEKLWREFDGDMAPVTSGLEGYIRTKPADRNWMNPATFLNGRRFEDQPATSLVASPPTSDASPRIDFGAGVSWPEPTVRAAVNRWRSDPSSWPCDRIGPPPNSPGCRVPEHLLSEAA